MGKVGKEREREHCQAACGKQGKQKGIIAIAAAGAVVVIGGVVAAVVIISKKKKKK